jgi:hypothetical protein
MLIACSCSCVVLWSVGWKIVCVAVSMFVRLVSVACSGVCLVPYKQDEQTLGRMARF